MYYDRTVYGIAWYYWYVMYSVEVISRYWSPPPISISNAACKSPSVASNACRQAASFVIPMMCSCSNWRRENSSSKSWF